MYTGVRASRCPSWWRPRRSSFADVTPQSQSGEIQLQLGHEFFAEGRYADALEPTGRRCTRRRPPIRARRAPAWCRRRCASRSSTRRATEADALVTDVAAPTRGDGALRRRAVGVRPVRGGRDALPRRAGRSQPELARGHHGMARSLAARSKLDEAMDEAQAALRLSPRDLEIHHTVGAIYERHAQVRRGRRRLQQLRQPAAEQGPQRQGRLVARRDQVPALVRPAGAVRDGSGRRRTRSTPSTSGW